MKTLSFLLLLSGCGTVSNPPPPQCRTDGQSCTITSDCCSQFVCANTRCTPPSPPKCGPTTCPSGCCDSSGTCRSGTTSLGCGTNGDACIGCKIGEFCTAQKCQPPACRSEGQTCSNDCCGGLTCYAGSCVKPGMTWKVTNTWGAPVDIEFWDRTANLVWPGNGNVYEQANGTMIDYPLGCTLGHAVCFGAEDLPGSVHWGVGLDHQFSCLNCCETCDGKIHTVTTQP